MPGARCTRGLVCMGSRKCAHEHTGQRRALRHSLRNGFTAYNVISPVIGFLATVAGGIAPTNLTPAPRRQDHTTSPYALVPFVKAPPRPPLPAPRFVTIASAPLGGAGWLQIC